MRRGYIDHDKESVYFWAQKCACTTLFSTLVLTYGNGPNATYQKASQPHDECLRVIQQRGYRSAAITRNPYDRMISCYLNKFVSKSGVPFEDMNKFDGFARKHYQVAAKKNGLSRTINEMTFEIFLTTIARLMKYRTDSNLNTLNGHCDTQVPPAMTGYQYDTIVRMENFTEDYQVMCQKYGLTLVSEPRNATVYSDPSDEYLGGLAAHDLFHKPLSKRNFRSPATDSIISRLYRDDFRTFGYDI
ncbi:MAG: sulfotransferase family 2 domain-containing protein [Flavimaricola sp.]|nr:sulfotransferase family 2 domain-containing protein [Flavimaricola sp.]